MSRLAEADLQDVPVFPLPHVVLFPEARLPLHIFEPRYRAMIADCLASEPRALVIAQIDRRRGRIAEIAGAGVIVEHQALPDGRSNIVVAGTMRVRLSELVVEEPPRFPYKRARAVPLASMDAVVPEADRSALLATATMFAGEVTKHDPAFAFRLPASVDAGSVADACAFHLVVDANVRQAILEELDPRLRVRMVMDQLALQHGAMRSETKGPMN
jgi:Lon protease-like protein